MESAVVQLQQSIVRALEADNDASLDATLAHAYAADIAEVLDLLSDEDRSRILYALPPRTAAEVVVLLDEAVRGEVVDDLDEQKLTQIVSVLPPDDAADVMSELTVEQAGEVLEHIPRAQSAQITELLTHDEASAGGIMDPRLLSLPSRATIGEAIESVRQFAADAELHYVYIIDEKECLAGLVPLRRLVVNAPDTPLVDVANLDPIRVSVDDDQEDVLQVIRKYDLAAVPVVDDEGRLVGRITHDDVMDVAQEEAEEDILLMAGTDAAELETHSSFRAARVRMLWLIPCMIGTAMVAAVIGGYAQTSIAAHMAVLTMFVPMIAATSGNAGIQVSTIVLRGFATGEIVSSKLALVVMREVKIAALVGILCGLTTGALSAAILQIMRGLGSTAVADFIDPWRTGVAVALGTICAIGESAGLGIFLPFLFRRVGVDPAIASGPLITSLNDLLSAFVYLGIALLILT